MTEKEKAAAAKVLTKERTAYKKEVDKEVGTLTKEVNKLNDEINKAGARMEKTLASYDKKIAKLAPKEEIPY